MANENNKLAPIDDFRLQLAHKDTYQQIVNYFGGDEDVARKFVSSAVHVCRKVPDLLMCSRSSLMESLVACAEYKLFPSAVSGEAFILPYNTAKHGKIAQFQLGYQGLITLFYRAGVESLQANIVYQNDTFHYQEGLHAILDHIPAPFGTARGKPIGVYAIAQLNGGKQIHKVMSEDEVMEFKKFSKSAGSKFSPWNDNDPERWMWKKTCIKQLGKLLPKNETLQSAIARDNEESTVSDIAARRSIASQLESKEKPTTGSLTRGKKKDHEESKNSEAAEGESLFGVADNHSADESK